MPLDQWLAFAAAASVVLVIPGPTILLVVSHALAHGRRHALATVAGVTVGDFTAMTLAVIGLGTLIAASAMLFTLLKMVGAAYLIWLGLKMLRRAAVRSETLDPVEVGAPSISSGRAFREAALVTTLNPKSIAFFLAFLPQFVDPTQPVWPQFAILEATFLALGTINAAAYAFGAAAIRRRLARPWLMRAFDGIGGSILVAAGAATILWRRAPAP